MGEGGMLVEMRIEGLEGWCSVEVEVEEEVGADLRVNFVVVMVVKEGMTGLK